VAALAAAIAALAPAAADAATTVKPPTIVTSYTPQLIGVSGTSAVAYTITNPNASGSLYNVGLTDSLPAGATVDNPVGESASGCGSAVTYAASPGAASVSLSGAVVKAGTPCVISFAITSNTPGTASDSFGSASYATSSASYAIPAAVPAANLTPAALTVLANPTITVKGLKNGAKLKYGQKVRLSFSCSQPGDPTALAGCLASDDLGNSLNSGGKLVTTVPGRHTLDIQALTTFGNSVDDLINYTVLPDNRFTLSSVKASAGGGLSFTVKVPGAGKLLAAEYIGKHKLTGTAAAPRRAQKLRLTLANEPAGSVRLKVTFTPKGGQPYTVTRKVTLL
jgi:hypothetical protein